MNRRVVCVLMLFGLPLLAGCTSDMPALTTRQTLEDSLVVLTVDSASKGLTYDDLILLVDNTPFKLGAHMDHGQRLFEVIGKDNPSDPVALGDVVRLPVSGKLDVELRHRDGTSLQQLNLDVPDHTPPAAPALGAPPKGANGVPRQAVFQWTTVDDPAGLTYSIEYWVGSQAVNAPATLVANLPGASYAVPQDSQLLPAATYHWRVRAVDGVGNVGPWSAESDFKTAV